ncbi:MAG TPA: response regulator [Candidatus Acidoferrum sp.]|nr:response regulator [Candidatus Acidoferrum sp.]
MNARPHLLIVDDEAGIRESLSSILREEGYEVETAGSAEEALERSAGGEIEVILLDVWLPGMDGLEALSRLQAMPQPPVVIMVSGHGTIETAVRATKLGAFDFIEKPLSLEKVIVLVRNAVLQRRLEQENQSLKTELGRRYQVLGESVPMKALAADCGDGADKRPRADLRRKRHRERTRGAHAAFLKLAQQGSVRRGKLRGDSRRAD